jgi:hypothetical protein
MFSKLFQKKRIGKIVISTTLLGALGFGLYSYTGSSSEK